MTTEYLNNKVFESIVARFKRAKKNINKDRSEFELAQMDVATAFYILAKNIIRAFKFQLVDKDDALQEGVMICFEKLHRFDPRRGKIFNYCTTIVLNHYRQLYRTAKNYNELKARYHDHLSSKFNDTHLMSNKCKGKNKYKKFGSSLDGDA